MTNDSGKSSTMSQVHQALKRLLLEHGERGEPMRDYQFMR